jgi:hypothetical protein
MKAQSITEIPIVLTATIKPRVAGIPGSDPEARLAEYRHVVQFCQQFAPVFFLENSDYSLDAQAAFAESPRLQVRRFPPSASPERGKGFQEFEMLDAWLAGMPEPPARWLKITGRYQVLNLPAILDECRHTQACPLLIDQLGRSRMARTYLFCCDSEFYRRRLAGLYRQCDDRTGDWVERVLFRALAQPPRSVVRCFATQPRLRAVAGSSGTAFPTGNFQWRLKQGLRRLNRLFDKRQLWYSR